MDSDDEITEDFEELVARGRNRTCRRRASQHDPHYISVDDPSFLRASGAPGTPSQDEQWWVSSFIEDSDEDSPAAASPVATSPQVCALPTSQVVPGESGEATSLNQDNVASTDSDSSSSASSPVSFAPASAALPLLPDDGASADFGFLPMVNFNRGAPALPLDEDNVASSDSDSSSSASSPVSFAPASAALPLFPDGGASDYTDIASLPAVNLNQSASALPVGEASDDTDIEPLPMVNLSQSASILQPAADGGADADFPMVNFNRGAAASPSSAESRQRNFMFRRVPRAPFHRRATKARRALRFSSPIARRSPRTPPAVQAAASSIQQSDNVASTDSDSSSSASSPVSFAPASAALPLLPDGGASDYTDIASLPAVNLNQSASALPVCEASDDTDIEPLPMVNLSQSASILQPAADGGADADFPMVNFNRGAAASPSSAESHQRNFMLRRAPRAPFHRRATKARRALRFSSPIARRSPRISPIARRSPRTPPAVQAAALSIQQSDNVASTDSDSSSSASSPVSFAPASAALPLLPVCEASDDTDIEPLPMVNLSQSASILQPAADGGADADFPMVNFNRGAAASPSSAESRQRNFMLRRVPRAPFHRRATKARRALRFSSPIARRSPRTPPAVQAAASSIQQSVCGTPADTDVAPLPSVPYSPQQQVSVRGSPADTDFASLPSVRYSPAQQVSVCGSPADTDFASLPSVRYSPPQQVSVGGASADTDFSPLSMVSFNRGAPASPSAAAGGASADTDFPPLSMVSFNRGAPASPSAAASTMPSRAVSLQPTRSALPPGAIPKRRTTFARAPFQKRPRRARRAMSFAPPTASRSPRNLPDERSAAGRRNILQAAASRNQQSDAEKFHHVIGEIAFQLDRRILSYIFVDHPRLYGFRIVDINERINEVAGRGRQHDEMLDRNTEIMNTLRDYGYCPVNHSTFSEFIVNTYGILTEKPQCQKMLENYNNRDYLYKLIVENTPPALLTNMLVLLNSLWHLSVVDGQPMFIW